MHDPEESVSVNIMAPVVRGVARQRPRWEKEVDNALSALIRHQQGVVASLKDLQDLLHERGVE